MMTMTPPKAEAPKPQIDKFRELARELECDEDEAAFDERVKKLVKAKPKPKPKAPDKPADAE